LVALKRSFVISIGEVNRHLRIFEVEVLVRFRQVTRFEAVRLVVSLKNVVVFLYGDQRDRIMDYVKCAIDLKLSLGGMLNIELPKVSWGCKKNESKYFVYSLSGESRPPSPFCHQRMFKLAPGLKLYFSHN
jgi:hypothetical protein